MEKKMNRLSIGSGPTVDKDWFGVDLVSKDPRVVICDITKGLPFKNNTIGEILCDNVLEHIPAGDQSRDLMNEIYRICKNKAFVGIIVPKWDNQAAWQDPYHIQVIPPRRALYWTGKNKYALQYGYTCQFDILSIKESGDEKAEMFTIFYLKAIK